MAAGLPAASSTSRAGGAKIEVEGAIAPGLAAQLRIGLLGQFSGVIVWRLGDEAGIRFANDPSEMTELVMGVGLVRLKDTFGKTWPRQAGSPASASRSEQLLSSVAGLSTQASSSHCVPGGLAFSSKRPRRTTAVTVLPTGFQVGAGARLASPTVLRKRQPVRVKQEHQSVFSVFFPEGQGAQAAQAGPGGKQGGQGVDAGQGQPDQLDRARRPGCPRRGRRRCRVCAVAAVPAAGGQPEQALDVVAVPFGGCRVQPGYAVRFEADTPTPGRDQERRPACPAPLQAHLRRSSQAPGEFGKHAVDVEHDHQALLKVQHAQRRQAQVVGQCGREGAGCCSAARRSRRSPCRPARRC